MPELWRAAPLAISVVKPLEWLNNLRPALPMSAEHPCSIMSNGELRRHIKQGGILLNGRHISIDEDIDPRSVTSLVFFPRSHRKTTVI